jgi:hypothetical protein
MRFLLPTVVAAVLITGPAEAEQESFAVIGFGTASCKSWTADRRSGQALGSEQWALGFAAGMANGLGPNSGVDPLSGVDAVWAWIDNYCQVHPLETVVNATTEFVFARPHPGAADLP